MAAELRLTLAEVAGSIQRQHGRLIPVWKLRRVVDSLESSDSLDVQRIGTYRTLAAGDVAIVADELHRVGWLESEAVPCK